MKRLITYYIILAVAVYKFMYNTEKVNKSINSRFSPYEDQLWEPSISLADQENVYFLAEYDSSYHFKGETKDSTVHHLILEKTLPE